MLEPGAAAPKPFLDTLNTPSKNVFTITSDTPISLTCYFVTHSGCEAYTPLPVERWGTEYFAASLRTSIFQHVGFKKDAEEVPVADEAPSEIIVIASEPNTDVTIHAATPLVTIGTASTSDTTIRLGAGEALLVEAAKSWRTDTITRDLSGTSITATKPVGVITGNTRTQGGAGANLVATATGNSGNNTALEWLLSTADQGTTFVYAPVAPMAPDQTEELVRVYATSPGSTTVSLSNGFPASTIPQGSYVTYSYSLIPSKIAAGSLGTPFAIRTDKPAQAVVITGSHDQAAAPTVIGEQTVETWSPTMSLLPPREDWVNSARFHAPLYPPYLQHYILIAADSSAQLWLDGTMIPFNPTPIPGAPFRYAHVAIAAGDHSLRCVKGRCAAIAYGLGKGVESYLPLATRKKRGEAIASGGKASPEPLHPSVYSEMISVAYAYPVAGIAEEALPPDSLTFSRVDKCDSSVVTVTRIGPAWTFVPYDVRLDPASVNTDADITPFWGGSVAGYKIRFKPIDPNTDAAGKVILTNAAGRTWEVPFSYKAHALGVVPDPVEMLDLAINAEQTLSLTFTNQKPFGIGILEIRLIGGATGFSLRGVTGIGSLLNVRESLRATLAFTGSRKNTNYYDTIVVTTTCGTFTIPVHARTGPSPVPVITGKDWGERLVLTTNDSLSIISNTGSLPFQVRQVTIDPNPSNAFSLIAPDWRGVPAVAPGESYPIGIRFTPPATGPFVGTILLVTADNDTARAELRGIGIMPRIDAADVAFGELCVGKEIDTMVTIANSGNAPLTIGSFDIMSGTGADIALDTIAPFLPRTLAAGDSFALKIRITPKAASGLAAEVVVHSDAFAGDSTIGITGVIATCVKPRLVVDDHDFDSVLITLTKPGFVTLRNLGPGDATVDSMTLAGDTASAFAILSPTTPFLVKDGDSVHIQCSFTPASVGLKSARIEFATDAGPLTSHLRGVGRVIVIPALIRRDYHAQPGEELTIYLELKGRLDTLPVQRLDIAIGYRSELLDFLAAQPDSAPRHGWRFFGAPDIDTLRYTIDVAGAPPDTGALLSMRFLTRFDTLASSELPFTIETGLPYVEVVESPGLFTRDPFCGLQERLFAFLKHNFRLEQNVPNPLNGGGRIDFEIAFDNPTTLIVYDARGQEMIRLVDRVLAPGAYTAYIQPGALPAGAYYYRLVSGPFTAIRKMVVE
jgi:hypothetical protein